MSKISEKLSKIKNGAKKMANSNGFIKLIISIVGFIISMLPTIIALPLYFIVEPTVFWEKLVTIALLIAVFGSIQITFLIVYFVSVIALILED